jgi:arsenate reductase
MAEGILKSVAGDILNIQSAGSDPTGYVHPLAIKALGEIGIDISSNTSKHMNEFLKQDVETVITVCGNANQACPVYPGQANRFHWPFDDPAKAEGSETEIWKTFLKIRDEIQKTFSNYGEKRIKLTKN